MTSARSSARRRSSSARSSSASRAPTAASIRSRAALSVIPVSRSRTSRSASLSSLFRPRYSTRTASIASVDDAAATAARAACSSASTSMGGSRLASDTVSQGCCCLNRGHGERRYADCRAVRPDRTDLRPVVAVGGRGRRLLRRGGARLGRARRRARGRDRADRRAGREGGHRGDRRRRVPGDARRRPRLRRAPRASPRSSTCAAATCGSRP